MEPHAFFLSYLRATNDSYLRQFFTDLDRAVRDKLGSGDATVGSSINKTSRTETTGRTACAMPPSSVRPRPTLK